MTAPDLRTFIEEIDKRGELRHVQGADWNLELGAITEVSGDLPEPPALLFDQIKGYPSGYRVLTNMFHTQARTALSLGLPTTLRGIPLVNEIRQRLERFNPLPPVTVKDGPVLQEVLTGSSVDLFRLPAPKLHRQDGGRYIGTADAVITRDPDEGWVNLGTARVQIHDATTLALYHSPGKQGRLIAQKYWARGQSCPVAVVCGLDPVLFAASALGVPWGVCEYDLAGHLQGEPLQVVKGATTGLPIPARAELVLEGEMPSPEVEARPEGPFGEWTGYYASASRPAPVIHVQAISHRHDPIITSVPDFKTYPLSSYMALLFSAAGIWSELEKCGISDVRGVWLTECGLRFLVVIAIHQRYPGHARQAAHVTTGAKEGGYLGRFVILVDEDIDPSNMADVWWAVATRCDPAESIEIAQGCWSSPIDPRLSPEKRKRGDFTSSRAIIDACRPFHWIDQFPPVHTLDPDDRRQVLEKWGTLLGL